MKNRKAIIGLITALSLLMLLWGCKKSNEAEEALVEDDIVRAVAQYYAWNVNPNSRLEGINKISLQGSQAFDAYHFGFDGGTGYFLENGNETVSFLYTVDEPDPASLSIGNLGGFEYNETFADGSYGDQRAWSGYMYPVPVTKRTKTAYDKDGNPVTDGQTYTRWDVTYNAATGYPETMVQKTWDASTDSQATGTNTNTITFTTEGAAPDRNYVVEALTVTDPAGDIVYKATRTETDNTGYTLACYSDNGNTLAAVCGLPRGAAKYVKTDEWDGTDRTITYLYYNSDNQLYYRQTDSRTYADLNLRHLSQRSKREYAIDPTTDAQTWQSGDDYGYTGAFMTSQTDYSAEDTINWTATYERDDQGRRIGAVYKDSAGNIVWEEVYTTDSKGRISSIREYGYSDGTRNTTPTCGVNDEARDYNWERTSDGAMTKTTLDYCDYDASTDTYSYSTSPVKKFISKYNAMGRITAFERYEAEVAGSYRLTYMYTKSYDTNGNLIKDQKYDVTDGTYTAVGYYEYEYDDKKFEVTRKTYDADGDLSLNPWSTSQKCTADSWCYDTVNYTYR